MRPSIFLDTGVIKACLDTRLMLLPECKKIMWAGHEIEATVHRPVYINQNLYFLRQGNRARFEDTVALRFIAALAKEGKIELQMQGEVFHELMGLPGAMDDSPLFHGAPITTVAGPVQYGRIVADGFGTDYQYEFLVSLTHSRFQALQKVCGAFQGHGRPLHRNQLIDAFHVWCAESSRATYFLTHDDKLVSALNRAKTPSTSVIPITPKRVLVALVSSHPTWIWSVLREAWRQRRSSRDLFHPAQCASEEFHSGKRPPGF